MGFTVGEYVQNAELQYQRPVQPFEVVPGHPKVLELNMGIPSSTREMLTYVWIKRNSMVAHRGEVGFQREGILEHGLGNLVKKGLTDEGTSLTKASSKGRAQLYLAHNRKDVSVFRLQGDSIVVNGNDLLAFEPSITHKIVMMKRVASVLSGGLFNVKLTGHGFVAITTHGKPIAFTVGQGMPIVYTDPDATVAWSGDLTPELKTDIQIKTFLGRGSGESFQMKFDGNRGPPGFILVQPYEERVSS